MSLQERLQADLKEAMRSADAVARDTLRMVMAALKNRSIERGQDLSEAEELAVLQKSVKTREDSAEQYAAAGRQDLADKERAEIEVVRRYLPEPLSEDEVRSIVAAVIEKEGLSSKKDLGKVMKSVLAEHKGRVDGKQVQRFAAELLG